MFCATGDFSTASTSFRSSPPERRIWLIEDNPGDVGLVREALEMYSVDADLVVLKNGEDASRCIEALVPGDPKPPCLIILDLNLPKVSGIELLRLLRSRDCCCRTPVIIFSSSVASSDRAETEALGISRYVRKPSTLDEFLSVGEIIKTVLAELPS